MISEASGIEDKVLILVHTSNSDPRLIGKYYRVKQRDHQSTQNIISRRMGL